MSSLISDDQRRHVADRADHLCEYCLLHEEDGFLRFQIDHIISLKHGGPTELDNLAFACAFCNRQKGSDIGTISPRTRHFIRFYNPRGDSWPEHFRLDGVVIEPLTEIGEGTARILGLNQPDRLLERQALAVFGRYPTLTALARIRT